MNVTMPPAEPTVEVACRVRVGTFEVAANFTATPGITALFGPSGSGKSVTLAAIAGLLRPEHGTISLDDTVVADAGRHVHVRTQQRHIGMVFQHAALLPHRDPLDNVAVAVRDGDKRQRLAVAQQWLDRVQAGHLIHSATRTLSGGEQQRVALARALAGQPRLLLLDEPFSALDHATRQALRQLVRDLVDAYNLTAIIVTHDLADITHLADRVVTFEPGRTTGHFDLATTNPDALAKLLGFAR